MRPVKESNSYDIKSVFNNAEDNLYYYNLIKNALGTRFKNIEFAKPNLHLSSGKIIWEADTEGEFQSLESISDKEVISSIGSEIRDGYEYLTERTKAFRNFPGNFHEQILEVPNNDAVLVFRDHDTFSVVLTEWGFLEDKLERRSGILKNIFPTKEYSILVRLSSLHDGPKSGEEIQLYSNDILQFSDKTDEQGKARLGILKRDQHFTIKSGSNSFSDKYFIVDGREVYEINLDKEGPISKEETPFILPETEDEPEQHIEHLQDHSEKRITLQFRGHFGRALSHLNISLERDDGSVVKDKTNNEGIVYIQDLNPGEHKIHIHKDNDKEITFQHHSETDHHQFITRQKIPWFWIIAIGIFLWLIYLCFFNVCCNCISLSQTTQQSIVYPTDTSEVVYLDTCDVQAISGGSGVTETQHWLGSNPGLVKVLYDMANIPDKLEVFYKGDLVTSTNDIIGHENGFVGGNNLAGSQGVLHFNYNPVKNIEYCLVRVSGPIDTKWEYLISCPD